MNLNTLAEQDLKYTIEDDINGFNVELIFYDNIETEKPIKCNTTDIGFFIDPDTGMGVQGRLVEIACRISTIAENNIPIEKERKVKYYDTAGNEWLSVIRKIEPDRKLGVYKLTLEATV